MTTNKVLDADQLTQSKLKELLHYDQETGVFTWIKRRHNSLKIGTMAGSLSNGYVKIKINDVNYSAHRLAWLYVYGEWPVHQIDHMNGIRNDNRISNIREATNMENMENLRKARSDSKTGLLGVSLDKKTYRAQIQVKGNKMKLGNYKTPEEAYEVYLQAKRILHPRSTL